MLTRGMSPRRRIAPARIEVELDGIGQGLAERPQFHAQFGDDYTIYGSLAEREGVMRLVEFRVVATGEAAEVTPTLLREIEVAKFASAGRQLVASSMSYFTPEYQSQLAREYGLTEPPRDDSWDQLVAIARRRVKAASRKATPGGSGRGDAFYRRIALDLIELVESGRPTPGGVLQELARFEADRLHQAEVPIETLRTWIRIARQREFLAPGQRGRMNAEPGRLLYLTEEQS